MKNIYERVAYERVATLRSELLIMRKRISDDSLLEIQKKVNKIKDIVDNEVNRRAENLNKQWIKGK